MFPTKGRGVRQSSFIASAVPPLCLSRQSEFLICGVGGGFQNGRTRLPTSDRTPLAHVSNGFCRVFRLRPYNKCEKSASVHSISLNTYCSNTFTFVDNAFIASACAVTFPFLQLRPRFCIQRERIGYIFAKSFGLSGAVDFGSNSSKRSSRAKIHFSIPFTVV